MKKTLIIALLIINFLFMQIPLKYAYASTYTSLKSNLTSPKHSTEELYKDIFCSLLLPYVQKSVSNFYLKYYTDVPIVDPWGLYILSAERPNGYQTFSFVLKIQVKPYVGPGIGVGVDNITITVDGAGNVKINKFEHIKDYKLPLNYQSIIKRS